MSPQENKNQLIKYLREKIPELGSLKTFKNVYSSKEGGVIKYTFQFELPKDTETIGSKTSRIVKKYLKENHKSIEFVKVEETVVDRGSMLTSRVPVVRVVLSENLVVTF